MLLAGKDRFKISLRDGVQGLCLVLASLATLAIALYPIYIIRPFREQKPSDLQRALWVQLHDRLFLAGLFILITMLALLVWRRAGLTAKILLLAPAMAIALLAAGACWVNPFEQMMFHAIGEPHYVTIQEAGIDAKAMVIVVTMANESRAYPIREMGYHHIVNDRLHQLPIVVTY
jgi:Protein of unknown function (DUF3179)